jgi:hypothetical protein
MSISVWNEKWLAFLAIIWGVTLMAPGDLFAGIQAYKLLSYYAPDTVWGLVLGLSGFFLLLPIPMAAHKHIHWILCTVWSGIGILCLLSRISPAVILFASACFTISMLHAGKFWRISRPPQVRL